jgi:glutathione S-transferase
MLTIYGSDVSSPANKVRFAANALGLKYEYSRVNLRAGEQQRPEFLKVNPIGKVPAIDDNGFCLFESNAIIKYLADKNNSALYPKELKARALVDSWIDFTTLHVGINLMKVTYNRLFAPMRGQPVDENSIKDGEQFLSRFLPTVDQQLGLSKYLCGPTMTLADINLLATLDPAEASQVDLSKYKNITKWRNALKKEKFYTQCHSDYSDAVKALMASAKK